MAREKIKPEDLDPPRREKIRPEDVRPISVPQKQLATPPDTDVLPTQDPELRQPPPLMMGLGKAASLGYIDEASGLLPEAETLEKVINPLGAAGSALAKYFSGEKPLDDVQASDANPPAKSRSYGEKRDDYRAQESAAKAGGPKEFLVGELAGGMMVPVPGGAGAKGLKKIAYSAATGGALGGVAGVGNSEADTVGGVVKDAGIGAAGGAIVAGGLTSAGVGVRKFMGKAEPAALKAAGAIQRDLKPLSLEERERIGRALLDEKVIKPFASKETILDRAKAAAVPAGEEVGRIVDKAAATPERITGPAMARKLEPLIEADANVAARDPYRATIQAEIDRLREQAPGGGRQFLSAKDVSNNKRAISGTVNYQAGLREPLPNEARRNVASQFRAAEEELIERALGPDELEAFKAAKKTFGDLQAPIKWAKAGVDQEAGNNKIGPTAAGAGMAMIAGKPVDLSTLTSAGVAAIALQVAKQRGDAAAAVFLDSIGHGQLRHLVHALSAVNIRSSPAIGKRLTDYFRGSYVDDPMSGDGT